MKDYSKMNEILINDYSAKPDRIINEEIVTEGLSFRKIRDVLICIGTIHFEDLESQIYIASINAGIKKKNKACMVLEMVENVIYIAVYAKEGLIDQHTSEGAINEFSGKIKEYIK